MISIDEDLLNSSAQLFTKMRTNSPFLVFMQDGIESKRLGEKFKVDGIAAGMLFAWSNFPVVLVPIFLKRIKTRKILLGIKRSVEMCCS